MPILENANTPDNAEQNLLDNDALEENVPTAPSHFKRKKHSKIDSSLHKNRLRPLSGDLIGKACSRTYLIFLTFFLSIFSFVRFFMIVAEIQHPARREFENQPYMCLVKVCIVSIAVVQIITSLLSMVGSTSDRNTHYLLCLYLHFAISISLNAVLATALLTYREKAAARSFYNILMLQYNPNLSFKTKNGETSNQNAPDLSGKDAMDALTFPMLITHLMSICLCISNALILTLYLIYRRRKFLKPDNRFSCDSRFNRKELVLDERDNDNCESDIGIEFQ